MQVGNLPCIPFSSNQLKCQVVEWEINNKKRIGNVCQQERIQSLRLQVLHQEGGQHLDHQVQTQVSDTIFGIKSITATRNIMAHAGHYPYQCYHEDEEKPQSSLPVFCAETSP